MNFKLRSLVAATLAGSMLMGFGVNAMADSTDDILNALIAKGILTEEEGALLQKGRTGEKEAAAKKKETAISANFKDGINWESGDKKTKMSINGRIQADYRSFDTPKVVAGSSAPSGVTSGANTADTFDMRRTYLTAKGAFRNTSFEATLNAGAVKYYWLEYNFSDKLNVRFGQFKTPMGLEVQTSSRFNDMTERDFTSALTDSINKGIMVHGVPTTGVTYQAMVSNGGLKYEEGETAVELSNKQDGKAYTGRLTANFAEIMGYADSIIHVGASYGVDNELPSYALGAVAVRTNGRGTTFFNSSALTNPDVKRYGFEGILAKGPVKLASEYNNASFEQTGVADKDISAYYVNASWMITGENYSTVYKNGLMGGRMIPKSDFAAGNGWGAWELGLRYSNFDAKDFTAASGFTNKADSWTAGLKWITDPNTRFLLDYVTTDFNTPVTGGYTTVPVNYKNEKAINFRAQFDF